jgi:hypothetical protein
MLIFRFLRSEEGRGITGPADLLQFNCAPDVADVDWQRLTRIILKAED